MPALDPAILFALRGALACILAAAAFHKWRDIDAFTDTLADYAILPRTASKWVGRGLPAGEALLSLGLLIPGAASGAALAAGLLLGVYSLAIAFNLARGRRDIRCGCGGFSAQQQLHGGLLWRNALLVGMACAAALPPLPRALAWIDGWSVAFAALCLSLLYAASDQLLANVIAWKGRHA